MRKTYKFTHSASQGGYIYAHKTLNNEVIKNKEGLRNALKAIAKRFELIDVTIKIYNNIFFLFFMYKPKTKPLDITQSIHKNISQFQEWDKDYLFGTVYDLQEQYLRKDLVKLGFDYDKG